jgi:3-hydroxyisobutyrate dehydrogenase-like beta-hydroxyacid dehydrogenase
MPARTKGDAVHKAQDAKQLEEAQGEAGSTTAVGFVGLGAMGSRIAGRFLATGHQLYGTNRTEAKAATLVERGLVWRDSPREVAEAASFVFTMVTDDAALDAIASGPDGLLAGLTAGHVWVDMSTVSPALSAALAERARRLGAALVDAPVSGSVHEAEDGRLTIMVGGDEDAFALVEPLLRELGPVVRHVGANGQGVRLKLALNISLAAQMLAFSEGVLLAERGGIERKLAVEVMAESSVGSPFLRGRAPLVLDLPDQAWFDVELAHKDIRLALATGERDDVPLPSAALADQWLTAAASLGYGHSDIASLYAVLAHERAEAGVSVSDGRPA